MSNVNYNDADAFVNMINKKQNIAKEEEKTRNEVARQVAKMQRDESCRKARINHIETQKRIYEEQKLKFKRAVAASLVGISLLGVLTVPGMVKDHKIEKSARRDINYDISSATLNLRDSGLGATDTIKSVFYVYDNSTSDYERLGLDDYDIKNIYIYSRILPEEELNDFIKNASYYDQDGNKHYYTSFDNYLIVNNFDSIDNFHDAVFELYKQPYDVYMFARSHSDEELDEYVKGISYYNEDGEHYYESFDQFLEINGFKGKFYFMQIIQRMFEDNSYRKGGK